VLREFPLPAAAQERAAAWLDGAAPAPDASGGERRGVRAAATVLLLRDAAGTVSPVEVFMLRRVAGMAFAAGMHVFPGGSVEERDGDTRLTWFGPAPESFTAALSADPALARALVVGAIRETFEECGVLLAGSRPDHVLDDVSGRGWERDRLALAAGELGLADVLGRRGLGVRADLLRPWAHWVTPPFERRRFDTRFFVAPLPAGQQARDPGEESDRAEWLPPAEALRQHRTGQAGLLPPTIVCLEEIATVTSTTEAFARPRRPRRVMPWLARPATHDVVLQVDLDGQGGGEPGR
jgi:8-oxo-dGTP pyrophosphatase MutT (NUDIX family)